MLANNIQETTTTTGTGDITLGGSSENGDTFDSFFATKQRFNYNIDDEAGNWESGVGYLSGATTLVREMPLRGSAATPVNFAAGTKQVFCAVNESSTIQAFPANRTPQFITWSSHFTNQQQTTKVTSIDNQQFVPFLNVQMKSPTKIGVEVTTAAGTGANFIKIGLYSIKADGNPDALLFESAALDPSTTGVKTVSLTGVNITTGWYYVSILADIGATVRSSAGADCIENPMGHHNQRRATYMQKPNATGSLFSDPNASGVFTIVNNISAPNVGFAYD
jgi:hypothetical protein